MIQAKCADARKKEKQKPINSLWYYHINMRSNGVGISLCVYLLFVTPAWYKTNTKGKRRRDGGIQKKVDRKCNCKRRFSTEAQQDLESPKTFSCRLLEEKQQRFSLLCNGIESWSHVIQMNLLDKLYVAIMDANYCYYLHMGNALNKMHRHDWNRCDNNQVWMHP